MKAEPAKERDRVELEIAAWLRTLAQHLRAGAPESRAFAHDIADRIEGGDYRVASEEPLDDAPNTTELSGDTGAIIKLRFEVRALHVFADVFMGDKAGELALSGRLVMTVPEWQAFEAALMLGAPRVPWCRAVVITEGRKSPP